MKQSEFEWLLVPNPRLQATWLSLRFAQAPDACRQAAGESRFS